MSVIFWHDNFLKSLKAFKNCQNCNKNNSLYNILVEDLLLDARPLKRGSLDHLVSVDGVSNVFGRLLLRNILPQVVVDESDQGQDFKLLVSISRETTYYEFMRSTSCYKQ